MKPVTTPQVTLTVRPGFDLGAALLKLALLQREQDKTTAVTASSR